MMFLLMAANSVPMEYYNIEDEEEHDEQEGQLPQLSHRKRQGRCHSLTHAHLLEEGGRQEGPPLKIAGQI
jgi:hypothetical protein